MFHSAIACLLAIPIAVPAAAPRGAVLITVDTLRADHLGFADGARVETPTLDRLARRGTVFVDAYSAAPATAPSHASLFTGVYPSYHTIGRTNGIYQLAAETPTLARRLSQAGIATSAVISNPVLSSGLGLEGGFHRFDDEMDQSELNRALAEQTADVAVRKGLRELEWLVGRGPFFLWLHLQDPHGPYTPPAEWVAAHGTEVEERGETLSVGRDHIGYREIPRYQRLRDERRPEVYRARYRLEIEYLDHEISLFLAAIENDPRFARTLIVLTSDHGEAHGEDGFYFAHGHSVGSDLTRVPLVFAGPGVPPRRRVRGAVSTVSLYATLLEYFGLEAEDGIQAGSLFPLLGKRQQEAREPVYFEGDHQVGVARSGVFLRRNRSLGEIPDPYGLPEPRVESTAGAVNEAVLGELEELLRSFEAAADRSYEKLESLRAPRTREHTEAEKAKLRALGYIQ